MVSTTGCFSLKSTSPSSSPFATFGRGIHSFGYDSTLFSIVSLFQIKRFSSQHRFLEATSLPPNCLFGLIVNVLSSDKAIIKGQDVPQASKVKYLGMALDSKLIRNEDLHRNLKVRLVSKVVNHHSENRQSRQVE